MLLRIILLAISLGSATTLQAAEETWWEAESDRFRVYSAGTKDDATKMVRSLERLDQAMRLFRGLPPDGDELADTAKVTVYQFGKTDDIGDLIGSDSVGGFFIRRAGNSVAFVPLEIDRQRQSSSSPGTRDQVDFYDYRLPPDKVLFHEYAHYFMYQHAAAAYPFWYIEGLAELFATIRLNDSSFDLGDVPEYRRGLIQRFDVDTERMFDPPERPTYLDFGLGYAHGWLATSYLSFNPSRSGQLANYLRLINEGTKSIIAAQTAFGNLKVLEKELNQYRKERVRGLTVSFLDIELPEVEVRRLPEAEAARMPLHIQQNAGVTDLKARRIVAEARKLAAQYPQNIKVLLTATEAEFDANNLAEADATAEKILSLEPKSITAMLYRARVAMQYAKREKSYLALARKYYLEVNQLNNEHPEALAGYYRTFALSEFNPPENALIALENAYRYAPFDEQIRLDLAHLLLTEDRDEEALVVLGPVINSPHADKKAKEYRELVSKLRSGDRGPLIKALAPKFSEADDRN